MSRFINADAMKQLLDMETLDGQRIAFFIDEQPTADVVEVVLCKDCLFGHRCFQVINGFSDSWVECQNPDGLNRTVSDNGFCSASIKRREE